MEDLKSIHIYVVVEAKVPQNTNLRSLGIGMANAKILDNFNVIESAVISTWSVEDVKVCNSRYITCPRCGEIGLLSEPCVILDGKPLCILCSAQFTCGDLPKPRTAEQIKKQIAHGKPEK